MKYTIREAIPADVAELARLRWEFRVKDQPEHSQTDFYRDCKAWLHAAMESRRWVIAVAETDPSSLCGCIYLQYVDKVPSPGGIHRAWGYITNSYVAPQQRGQGIGEKLLKLLIGTASDRNLEFLIVWPSEGSVSFYRRAGFQPLSDAHIGADDEPPLELVLSH